MAKKKVNNKAVKNKKQNVVSTNELVNLIKIIVIVCLVLLVFYFITTLVKDKKTTNYSDSDKVAVIQYEKIMVGQILNRTESDYYVLVEKENDVNIDLYKSYTSIYSGKENSLKVYTVDLGDVFNTNYVGEETVIDSLVANFKFNDTTLIKVSNETIESYFVGSEEIENYLNKLIK